MCNHGDPTAAHICVGDHSDPHFERADHLGGLDEVGEAGDREIVLAIARRGHSGTAADLCVREHGDHVGDEPDLWQRQLKLTSTDPITDSESSLENDLPISLPSSWAEGMRHEPQRPWMSPQPCNGVSCGDSSRRFLRTRRNLQYGASNTRRGIASASVKLQTASSRCRRHLQDHVALYQKLRSLQLLLLAYVGTPASAVTATR